ncbi:MAG TPA: hypothetical protein DCE42_16545 [Myxococcales bacterium]|nr:hypothetical protein [Deltaproteobacteria bacterium]MBU52591.1 hypothetical protein [Deltaproteobacteria bacterium]HAA56376.1 hypothetical protein [Myxococcales bacterium]|tara:strand:- start:12947 stop:13294 length:348 start_codon:yes stop_codon:yes gene_type:complete
MSQLEMLDRKNLDDFLAAPRVVLMLGKKDCAACNAWTEELNTFLAEDETWSHVRFGKLLIDQPGLIKFKRDNPWLAEVTDLPYNVIYKDGEIQKKFAGAGLERLTRRMEKTIAAD